MRRTTVDPAATMRKLSRMVGLSQAPAFVVNLPPEEEWAMSGEERGWLWAASTNAAAVFASEETANATLRGIRAREAGEEVVRWTSPVNYMKRHLLEFKKI